jgi:hypothetical protein
MSLEAASQFRSAWSFSRLPANHPASAGLSSEQKMALRIESTAARIGLQSLSLEAKHEGVPIRIWVDRHAFGIMARRQSLKDLLWAEKMLESPTREFVLSDLPSELQAKAQAQAKNVLMAQGIQGAQAAPIMPVSLTFKAHGEFQLGDTKAVVSELYESQDLVLLRNRPPKIEELGISKSALPLSESSPLSGKTQWDIFSESSADTINAEIHELVSRSLRSELSALSAEINMAKGRLIGNLLAQKREPSLPALGGFLDQQPAWLTGGVGSALQSAGEDPQRASQSRLTNVRLDPVIVVPLTVNGQSIFLTITL